MDSSEKTEPDFDQTNTGLRFLSTLLFLMAIPMLFVNVFSIPFPFVRQPWMKEIVGLSGLLNALLFGWISVQMQTMRLPPVVAGIGLFLNEQLLSITGFLAWRASGQVARQDFFLLAVFLLADIIFLGLLLHASLKIIVYKKWFYRNGAGADRDKEPVGFSPLLVNGMVYGSFFASLYAAKYLSQQWLIAELKAITLLACFVSWLGIGYEIQFYLRRSQGALQCGVKALTHVITLAMILWLAYRQMPVEAMLRSF